MASWDHFLSFSIFFNPECICVFPRLFRLFVFFFNVAPPTQPNPAVALEQNQTVNNNSFSKNKKQKTHPNRFSALKTTGNAAGIVVGKKCRPKKCTNSPFKKNNTCP